MLSHAFYVYTAYGVTFLLVAAMSAYVYLDGKARQRELKALENAGIRRRSAGSGSEVRP